MNLKNDYDSDSTDVRFCPIADTENPETLKSMIAEGGRYNIRGRTIVGRRIMELINTYVTTDRFHTFAGHRYLEILPAQKKGCIMSFGFNRFGNNEDICHIQVHDKMVIDRLKHGQHNRGALLHEGTLTKCQVSVLHAMIEASQAVKKGNIAFSKVAVANCKYSLFADDCKSGTTNCHSWLHLFHTRPAQLFTYIHMRDVKPQHNDGCTYDNSETELTEGAETLGASSVSYASSGENPLTIVPKSVRLSDVIPPRFTDNQLKLAKIGGGLSLAVGGLAMYAFNKSRRHIPEKR